MYKILSIGKHKNEPLLISIETNIRRGIPVFEIIGKVDKTVSESRLRVLSTLKTVNEKIVFHKKITTLLSPAHIEKRGSLYDLAIAMSCYTSVFPDAKNKNILKSAVFIGELDLYGNISIGYNTFDLTYLSYDILSSIKYIFAPEESKVLLDGLNSSIRIIYVKSFKQALEYVYNNSDLAKIGNNSNMEHRSTQNLIQEKTYLIDQIQGLECLKKVLTISLAGRHHLLMVGSPGGGKSSILDCVQELIEYNSETDQPLNSFQTIPGVQRVNHSTSKRDLLGGEQGPGEIAFANQGCLLFDEFFESNKTTLSSLREPIEDGYVSNKNRITFTNFTLIGATNPCDCGNYKSNHKCVCTRTQIEKYIRKTKTPLYDRIDITVNTNTYKAHIHFLTKGKHIVENIKRVRCIQDERMKAFLLDKVNNSHMKQNDGQYTNFLNNKKYIQSFVSQRIKDSLSKECIFILEKYIKQKHVSHRHIQSIILISRTIADVCEEKEIGPLHLIEAIRYKKNFFEED